ncbi:MAG: aldehyde dehydrogenase (NADP(+)) [Verrucomicrobiota bacterium]
MKTQLVGTSFIGFSRSNGREFHCNGIQPGSGEELEPPYFAATDDEVETAMALAAAAFPAYSALSGKVRAEFLRAIAVEIEAITDDIAARGQLETALPEPRLRGETARTTGQLRLFAKLIEEGSWVDARIDRADPDRKPLPKVDLRSMLCPLGPVAVFCASNFPMAYSVAGGDTASALAAGCPVVVIAHEAHPGVAEITAAAVIRAAQATGMPEGVFSVLYGGGRSVGQAVVKHPATRAVGFTGSRAGGTALMEIATKRPRPIPVYAEMSSINPLVILPGALARGEDALAEAFFGSLTLGVGQFCTNPGLVFLPTSGGDAFLAKLKSLIEASTPGMMLHQGISESFAKSKSAVASAKGVETLAKAEKSAAHGEGAPAVFTVSMADFLTNPSLQHEMFGPATLIVRGTPDEIEDAIPHLEGQLTASLHATDDELAAHSGLVRSLQEIAGRLIFNGFPTGVEVCDAIVHGGPFPATSDGRSTSVGTAAIFRFTRSIAWQSFPDTALPPELQEANPLGIHRTE